MLQSLNPRSLALRRQGCRGLTLIEIMIVLAVAATLVALTAPSFKRMIDGQRLRSINAALVTDLQYARAEAASRNQIVWLRFNGSGAAVTCYAVLTGDPTVCNCQNTPVCPPGSVEIRTVRVEQSLGVTVRIPSTQTRTILGFDPATGRLWGVPVDIPEPATAPFQVLVSNPAVGGFLDEIELTGRPTVCSPGGQLSGVPACS